jgi:hypothetical protein
VTIRSNISIPVHKAAHKAARTGPRLCKDRTTCQLQGALRIRTSGLEILIAPEVLASTVIFILGLGSSGEDLHLQKPPKNIIHNVWPSHCVSRALAGHVHRCRVLGRRHQGDCLLL